MRGNLCSNCGQKLKKKFEVKGRVILACGKCGLGQVSNRYKVVVNDTIETFTTSYLDEYKREKSSYIPYFQRLLSLLEHMPRKGRIIDVGCARGFFLEVAKGAGYIVEGVDASKIITQDVRRKGYKVHLGLFENIPLPSEKYDAVVLLQTIEHVWDLQGFLRKAKKIIKPGGYLLVTTPDKNGFLGRLMGKWWFTYHNWEHLYFFSPACLQAVLHRAGFVTEKLYTEHGRLLTTDYVFSRLINNYYNHGLVTRILKRLRLLLSPIAAWTFSEPWVNVVAVMRKPG